MRATGPDAKTCTIDGCDRTDLQGHGMCQMHYYRARRNGSPGTADRLIRAEKGICVVDGCAKKDRGPHGMCAQHWTRVQRHGAPDVKYPAGSPSGPGNPKWLSDEAVSYNTAHLRLKRLRGPARDYVCDNCAVVPARHWAYDHADPSGRESEWGPYSADPAHYRPLCVPCHKKFDLAQIRLRAAAGPR